MSKIKITNKEIREGARVVSHRYNSEKPTTAIVLRNGKGYCER